MYSRERRITAWKVSVFGVFLVRFFSAFGLNAERYELEKLQIRGLITHWITHNLIVITMIAILYELFLLLQVLKQQSKTHVCLEWPENNSRVLFMHNQKNNFDSARFFGMVPPRYQPSEKHLCFWIFRFSTYYLPVPYPFRANRIPAYIVSFK